MNAAHCAKGDDRQAAEKKPRLSRTSDLHEHLVNALVVEMGKRNSDEFSRLIRTQRGVTDPSSPKVALVAPGAQTTFLPERSFQPLDRKTSPSSTALPAVPVSTSDTVVEGEKVFTTFCFVFLFMMTRTRNTRSCDTRTHTST